MIRPRLLVPLTLWTAVAPAGASRFEAPGGGPSFRPAVASATASSTSRPRIPPARTLPDSSDGLRAALDSVIRQEMARGRIPGLAVVALREGEISFSRGYGVADLTSGQPVVPARTRFPLGSLSKLVTATALMQLVEAGDVSLHRGVGRHLDPAVLPSGPGGPITPHHLLTHTAGFEPSNLGVAARAAGRIEGLAEFLSSHRAARVRPPGELYVYSQHGYGLAGRVVANVSGRDFSAYVRERIFSPLGMESASMQRRPTPEGPVATGYYGGKRRRPAPAVFHRIPPAGGLIATPIDIARLLAAHLDGGGPILGRRATRRMHRRHWSPHPDPTVEGTSYGLFGYRACGIRALTSRGWVGGHASYVHLVPERGAGFLITTNASDLHGLDQRLRELFHVRLARGSCLREGVDRPAGERGSGGRDGDGREIPAPEVEGSYRSIGYGRSGVEAIGRLLLSPVLTVRRSRGGRVVDFGGETARLTRVDSLLYRASWWEGRNQNFAFLHVEDGRPRHMMWGGQAYERIPWILRPTILWSALGLAGAIFLAAVVVGVTSAVRRLDADVRAEEERRRRVLRGVGVGVAALYLLFGVGMGVELAGTARYEFAFGVPPAARILLWIPTLGAVLTPILAGAVAVAWRGGYGSLTWRLHWTAVTLAAGAVPAAAAVLGLLPP